MGVEKLLASLIRLCLPAAASAENADFSEGRWRAAPECGRDVGVAVGGRNQGGIDLGIE